MTPDEIHGSIVPFNPDPSCKNGMTNLDWANKLLADMDGAGWAIEKRASFLAEALDIACRHSERPGDRIAKSCLIPGHQIVTEERNEAVVRIVCMTCNRRADLEKTTNTLLLLAIINLNKELRNASSSL